MRELRARRPDSPMNGTKEFRILSPTAILGYGFPEASFLRGMAMQPDLIAVDAGSADPGPYYLGAGVPFTDRAAVKRDLRIMIRHARQQDIPVVVGTCGGSGAAPHLAWTLEITEEILAEEGIAATIGVISADVAADTLIEAMRRGEVVPSSGAPGDLAEAGVRETTALVAQMGVEPIMRALEAGCNIVLAGRAYDPSVFAALPVMKGYDIGLAIHLGKILECAAIAASPGSGADAVLGILHEDSFELVPLSDERRFTVDSVAAHSLYEKSDPIVLPGPGGVLDLSAVSFTEEAGGRVRVRGSRFVVSEDYWVKLEGARRVGFRSISIAGVRDPVMIGSIKAILEAVKARTLGAIAGEGIGGSLCFHVYGVDAVMGEREPVKASGAHEVGIVIEAIAPTQAHAATICSLARSTLLHYGYPGRIATAGNLAFPFSPSDIRAGEVYEFAVYHLMKLRGQELFPLQVIRR